jgi:hypothetical protein
MAILFMDGFDHYGNANEISNSAARDNMLDNVYANVGTQSGPSETQARTGSRSYYFNAINGQSTRRVFPGGGVAEVFVGFALFAPVLPNEDDRIVICQLLDSTNAALLSIVLLPDGSLAARNGNVTTANVAVTNGPAVGAAAWNHIEVRAVQGTGLVEIRVNGVEVMSATGFTFGATFAQYGISGRGAGGGGAADFYFDDLIVNDTSGSYNTTWKGDLRVATLFPNEDGTPDGWARNGRDKFGNGVLDANDGTLYYSDIAGFDIGSGDYTVETWLRFYNEPGSGQQTIAGQWDELNNQRSWRLYRDFDAGGNLKLDISTDGTLATVSTVLNWANYQPVINRWSFLSVSRISGVVYLHVDGILQGAGVADASTYHNSTSPLWIGTSLQGTGPNSVASDNGDFYADEFRFTVGTGRYNGSNYATPSAAFPRSAPSDPNFANVQLLLGFNADPIVDDSSNGLTAVLTSVNTPEVVVTTGDALGKYAVVDEDTPNDRTFIAADFLFATGQLTLTANAANTETVTLGSQTYTFVTTLSGAADEVLIGVDADTSINNLVAAINGAAGAGTIYGTGTATNTSATAENLGGNQLQATAATQGTAGNSVATTETLASGAWGAATLEGGADIPAAQNFSFSPLPIDTTQVLGVQLYHRSAKSDSGACQLQTSFVVGASSANGADRPITTAFSYWGDVFEEDPDTSAGLTVNSIVAGSFSINRTT